MSLKAMIATSPIAAVISDPRRPDNPIVECNDAFVALTGYSADEIIGQNCRFLTGPGTEAELSEQLRSAIRAHANFAEYVPITVLMIAMLEMAGMPAGQVHWLMGVLLLSRLIHPLGLYVGPRTWQFQVCRVGGIALTLFVMVSAVISGLVWFWPR